MKVKRFISEFLICSCWVLFCSITFGLSSTTIEMDEENRVGYVHSETDDMYYVDLTKNSIQSFLKTSQNEFYTTFANCETELASTGKKMVFATNGGMFHANQMPVGLYIENGIQIQAIDTLKKSGNFYLMPNGIFSIEDGKAQIRTTTQFIKAKPNPTLATQSGPILVTNGKIHPAFNRDSPNRYIRSGVGIIDETHLVFVISNKAVNFHSFAILFRDKLNCQNALYLDGAISKMFVNDGADVRLEDGAFGVILGVVE